MRQRSLSRGSVALWHPVASLSGPDTAGHVAGHATGHVCPERERFARRGSRGRPARVVLPVAACRLPPRAQDRSLLGITVVARRTRPCSRRCGDTFASSWMCWMKSRHRAGFPFTFGKSWSGTCGAGSWLTGSCVFGARTARTTCWWASRARVVGSAPRAAVVAWRTRLVGGWTECCLVCPGVSGC